MLPQLCPSGIIDLTNPKAYEWYRDQHKDLFELGVAVMKTDFGESVPDEAIAYNGDSGERLHNVYSLLYNQCVYEATTLYGKGKPMVWGRSGWTGSQRFHSDGAEILSPIGKDWLPVFVVSNPGE